MDVTTMSVCVTGADHVLSALDELPTGSTLYECVVPDCTVCVVVDSMGQRFVIADDREPVA
jgi:hypothetical protein